MNTQILVEDVLALSEAYSVELADDYDSLLIRDFNLPPGYNWHTVTVKLEVPEDYPESPPGVGNSHVYLPNGLRYQDRIPNDYHESWRGGDLAWWCYRKINWDPCRDTLITFFELLRAHMTDPP